MQDDVACRTLVVSTFRVKNVLAIRRAVEHHARTCCDHPVAILLNPVDHGVLGITELWGLPVKPDDSVVVKRFVFSCLSDTPRFESALDAFIEDVTGE